ncbi:uncharacterized protein LY89DRAFT_687873 [Mollisia scopiformis]|uniref:F-box domain-containing protein n=1 Tax=Mollisia scopiformis TaxID=149040 RepID=A0A194WYB7_MOLSC|nr:uncharacterized protein LY89DRAFT_687873 [Mollisia scopiformis]KUJ12961.1 hypothetical protein LY89DRAFT_687873 [Mollisia scopiformis]
MASSTLLGLPLELRIQIYSYLFTAPRSRIELKKGSYRALNEDGGEEIQMCLLRTCKQIYNETRDIWWKYNTLHLRSILNAHAPAPEGIIAPNVAMRIKSQVRSVQMNIDTLFYKTIADRLVFGHNLSILAGWAQEGQLSSITLNIKSVAGRILYTHRQWMRVLGRHRDSEKDRTHKQYLEELRFASTAPNPLSTIKRRIVLETRSSTFEPDTWRPRHSLRVPKQGHNPIDMLQELASAWGGRLEVNGMLAYEDGNPVGGDILLEQSEPRLFYYKDDVHLWLMTEIVKEPVQGKHIGQFLLDMDRSSRAAFYGKYETELQALKQKYGIHRVGESSVAKPAAGEDIHRP